MRNHRYLTLVTILLLFSTPAAAVELGKIDINSDLGRPFHAEIPLMLGEGEVMSNLLVELAAPADYRTLNVHRDPAVNMIHADATGDIQGTRIELSSRYPINTPTFSLILKVRYGRASHYKKYSIVLDLPRAGQHLKRPHAVDIVDTEQENQTETESPVTEEKVVAEIETATPATAFQPFDGWARTSRYGPIIYGDTIHIIADRLLIDERYNIRQVMVALFEKNRNKFAEENLNLPLSGSYFDVPTAEEVERLTYEQALAIIAEHDQRWQKLKQQPRYAVMAKAQRNRYSKREHVVEDISGRATEPISDQ